MGLFKKKSEPVFSPVAGRIVSLDEVPDPVFAHRSIGDGFAVEAAAGEFKSPVTGELVLVADTRHAFGVRTPAGAEILVHIGIDTVVLKGAGFTVHRNVGDALQAGDVVISCDIASVAGQVPSMATPVLLTNGDAFSMSPVNFAATETPVMTVRRLK